MFPNGQEINSNLFLNFEDVLLMVEILHQIWYHICPIIYRVLYIPGGFLAGFLPSTVAVVCFPKDGDRHSRSGRSFWSGISDLPPDPLEYQNTEIPWKINGWNPKMEVSKMLHWLIFRFHVNFPGCM